MILPHFVCDKLHVIVIVSLEVAADEVLQLTIVATETSKGLILKPAAAADKKAHTQNGFKTEINILNGCLIHEGINLVNIRELSLTHCALKTVPNELAALVHLKVLNLSHNNLVAPPECLETNLRYIEFLDLSYNRLNEFEIEPACYKRLKVLLLSDNNLLNIPEWILYVRCVNMEEFDFSYNEINRLYASQFNVWSNYMFKKLILQSCYVFDRDFKYINWIKTLEYLDVSNHETRHRTNIVKGDSLFTEPFFADTLKVLKLNYLTLSILSENVICFVNLRELYLIGNNLSWLPEGLACLRNLEILDISENTICYLPKDFFTLFNLKKLVAYRNNISHLPDLSKMKQLCYLDLYKNMLTDFPFDIDLYTHLDLEQNCFDANEIILDYAHYIKKRENLRSAAQFNDRINISNYPSEPEQSSCSDSTDSYSNENFEEEGEELKRVTEECTEEFWGFPYTSDYHRVCTTSDDEWLGSEPPLVALRKIRSRDMRQLCDSPTFSDAD